MAGGSGTRLYPATLSVSKQLLPLYDKPMIFYPLSVLMLAGVREIAVITTPEHAPQFRQLLGDGSRWGVQLNYIPQPAPEGLAQAYLLAEDWLAGAESAMILGDNIFFGQGLSEALLRVAGATGGGTIFGYQVSDPQRYGVIGFDAAGAATSITEKPAIPESHFAVTGLYFLDGSAPERARSVTPSARRELEITCLLESYLRDGALTVERLGRGFAWLDTGTHDAMLDAANFVRSLQARQGLQVGCLEEIAFRRGWIEPADLAMAAQRYVKNTYGQYLMSLLDA